MGRTVFVYMATRNDDLRPLVNHVGAVSTQVMPISRLLSPQSVFDPNEARRSFTATPRDAGVDR